jgi:hypothetical protein
MNYNEKDCIRSAQVKDDRVLAGGSAAISDTIRSIKSLYGFESRYLLVSKAGDRFALGLERWHGCTAGEFDAVLPFRRKGSHATS